MLWIPPQLNNDLIGLHTQYYDNAYRRPGKINPVHGLSRIHWGNTVKIILGPDEVSFALLDAVPLT